MALTKTDLQAISALMTPIIQREMSVVIQNMATKEEVGDIKNDISGIKDEVNGIKDEVSGIKGEISGIKGEISAIKGEISGIKGEISAIKGEINHIKADMESKMATKDDLKFIEKILLDEIERVHHILYAHINDKTKHTA